MEDKHVVLPHLNSLVALKVCWCQGVPESYNFQPVSKNWFCPNDMYSFEMRNEAGS